MPRKLHEIHDAILRNPDFKSRAGRTRDEAAWAIAQGALKRMNKAESSSFSGIHQHDDVPKHYHSLGGEARPDYTLPAFPKEHLFAHNHGGKLARPKISFEEWQAREHRNKAEGSALPPIEKTLPKGLANPFTGGKTQPSKEFMARVEQRWLAKPKVEKALGAQREVDQLHDERASLRSQPTSGAAEQKRRGRLRQIADRLDSWEGRGVHRSPFKNPLEKALGAKKVKVNTMTKGNYVAFLADLVKDGFKPPKLGVPEQHQLRIARDTLKNPAKALLGGPSVEEAHAIVRRLTGRSMRKADGCDEERDLTNRAFEKNKERDPRSAPPERDLQKADSDKKEISQGRISKDRLEYPSGGRMPTRAPKKPRQVSWFRGAHAHPSAGSIESKRHVHNLKEGFGFHPDEGEGHRHRPE